MGSFFWKTNASVNKYSNFKTGFAVEWFFIETNVFNISTITSIDKKTRISSNGLIDLFSFSLLPLLKNHENYILLPLLPELLGNAKIYLPAFTKRFWIGGGLNTDYYLFYKNSVIYSEGLAGIKISTDKLRIYANYRFPINGSYLESKKPYINIGIGLFPSYYD